MVAISRLANKYVPPGELQVWAYDTLAVTTDTVALPLASYFRTSETTYSCVWEGCVGGRRGELFPP